MLDYIKFFNNFILKYEYMIKWNTLNWIIFSIITLILGLSIIYHIYINRKHRMKFTLIKLFLIISYTALYIGLMVYKDINFHIHHWYIGFIFSVICDNDKILSQLLHYIFLGIYIQGVSVYNIANLYDN